MPIKKINTQFTKTKFFDYFILSCRVLLAWTFLNYGWNKLTGNQFGISEDEMSLPLNKLSKFKIGWYLFDLQPFKSFVGIGQIICALLILWNRTLIIGCLLFLPICLTILFIDLTIMSGPFAKAFLFRLSYYLLLIGFIFYYYRSHLSRAINAITTNMSFQNKFPIWMYLLLPISAIFLDFIGIIPKLIYDTIAHPEAVKKSILYFYDLLINS